MARLIRKLVNTRLFNRHSVESEDDEAVLMFDMDEYEWKGWDAWVEVKD